MKIVNNSKSLLVPLKTGKKMIEHIYILKALETEGEAGKIGEKQMIEKCKESNIKYNIKIMFQLAYIGVISLCRTPFFSKAGFMVYPYKWNLRSNHDEFVKTTIEKIKTIEENRKLGIKKEDDV
jgi:hypothetical protein